MRQNSERFGTVKVNRQAPSQLAEKTVLAWSTSSAGSNLLGAGLGYFVDSVMGEPKCFPHPVALFGSLMGRLDRKIWANSKPRGIALVAIGSAASILAAKMMGSVAAVFGRPLRMSGQARVALVNAIATQTCISARCLHDTALEIGSLLETGDLEAARAKLPSLVGRDPSILDEKAIAAAVVESVAENTVDAIIAPLFWSAVGGAAAVLEHRAVNTLDSMVGYKTERYAQFGWASARLDDLANWVPARLTALVVVLVAGKGSEIARVLKVQSPAHPSPNAGVAEGAFAAALGLRLGGTIVYPHGVEERPVLGFGSFPTAGDICRAVELSRRVGNFMAAMCLVGAGASWVTSVRSNKSVR
ncbi:MAG TPA: adenosylcobinamide-phosphate synthase CbiB [Acidimicrobiales bacterium]|nr:adenosylcobinamide-phosphate synthase CbiB [Acidimicrobiales bacterium]